jgi:hypothetical protein
MIPTKLCRKCGVDKPLSAYRPLASGTLDSSCRHCREDAKRAAAHARRQEQLERLEALRDEIWSAMWRGRSHRALTAVQPKQQGMHRLRLRHESGYITISELACRCAERDACHRAARVCQTADAAKVAVRILELPTPTLERTRQVNSLWRVEQPSRAEAILRDASGADEDLEGDPFEEAFGDWAPSWVSSPSGLSGH